MLAFGGRNNPDGALYTYEPSDPEHFGFSAQVFVGGAMSDECDSFDVTGCSPSWFASEVAARGMEHFNRGGEGSEKTSIPAPTSGLCTAGTAARFEEALRAAFPKTSEDVATWETCARLLPHALASAAPADVAPRRAGVDKLAP